MKFLNLYDIITSLLIRQILWDWSHLTASFLVFFMYKISAQSAERFLIKSEDN